MLLLIKKYYPLSPSFMGIISNCVLRGMAMSNPEHQCVSITFWQDLAQFEYAYQNRPTFKCDLLHLSRTVIENYFEIFINILQSIDPNDVSIEDPGDKLPHMRATTALQSIYKVEPEIVFEKCSQTIINLIKEQQSWVHCHTALLLIYSILEHPINNVIFLPFLGNVFDYVIDFCTPKYCAHLRETA
ncbi:uncharacterized protein GO595_009132 [Histomonas meleagridis]|uniref:uncharacterized protein n=1 Tax=Histomonas meleagridis TaxID=135588 RepID=UPI00355A8979|nr:hypothetical protein GO595_009132 [Histomonas meleagridis]